MRLVRTGHFNQQGWKVRFLFTGFEKQAVGRSLA
jgi:hypothetical protein